MTKCKDSGAEQSGENCSNIPPKKYASPTLVDYGRVRDLTTGGSGMASESEMGSAKPRP